MMKAILCVLIAVMAGSSAWAADLLVDDFSAGSIAPDGRIYEWRLDNGWRSTSAWPGYPASEWALTGGRLENPSIRTDYYSAGETPAYHWWTNPETNSTRRYLRVSFDYGVGAGSNDTLTCHFWAAQDGGATGAASFISNNQGWQNGNSGQNQDKSLNYDTFNLLNGDTTPDNAAHISGHLTGTGTFVWEVDVASLGIPGVTTVGDIDTLFIAFAANETGGGTTWIDNLAVSDWPPNVLTEDFSVVSTPPDQWRIYEWFLDTGWNATRGVSAFSNWDIVSNRLENPSVGQDHYIEGESPAWKWWTNHESDNTEPGLRVSFDYGVGSGSNDTLTAHFWAVQTNGPTGTETFVSNIEGWQNGNCWDNKATTTNGYVSYNLLDGANPPSNTGSISGHLTGTNTFSWQVDLVKLGIPGVETVGDVDTFFIAFAANETGGGTTWVDNVSSDAIHIPRGLRFIVR